MTFLLEGLLMIFGMILGGQAIGLALKWMKYLMRQLDPENMSRKKEKGTDE